MNHVQFLFQSALSTFRQVQFMRFAALSRHRAHMGSYQRWPIPTRHCRTSAEGAEELQQQSTVTHVRGRQSPIQLFLFQGRTKQDKVKEKGKTQSEEK